MWNNCIINSFIIAQPQLYFIISCVTELRPFSQLDSVKNYHTGEERCTGGGDIQAERNLPECLEFFAEDCYAGLYQSEQIN